MGKSMFARGYSASRAEKERQDKARENAGKRLFRFFLKDDGEEAARLPCGICGDFDDSGRRAGAHEWRGGDAGR